MANVFLEVLFHDVKLDYQTPIISQQGEVAGRLQVEITRIAGQMPQDRMCETSSENSHDSREDDFNQDPASNQITCRVNIKMASGLPISLSNYVFCQYTFWGHQEMVVPVITSEAVNLNTENNIYCFEHVKDYTVQMSEEFLEHCAGGLENGSV